MADSKVVVVTAKLKFAGTEYGCLSLPPGIPQTTDLPDVTVLTDVEQRFDESALVEDASFTAELEGDCDGLLNEVGAVQVVLTKRTAGGSSTTDTISFGDCIVTNVEPATLEAGGDRVRTSTVTFQPNGTRT